MARKARGGAVGSAPADVMAQLDAIARNLWWSWNPEAKALFEHANARAFAASDRNPVVALEKLSGGIRAFNADHEKLLALIAERMG